MRFTTFFTLMAAGSAFASLQPGEEETTTLTQTTTKYLTITKCAEGNPNCPAEQPSTSEVPVEPTPAPEPTYAEPEPVPETSSIVIVEVSSALPEVPEPSSSAFYPVQNSTSYYVAPTGSVPHTTLSYSVPVVTQTTVVGGPASSAAGSEPSQVAGSGAASLSLKGGLLAGVAGFVAIALF